MTAAPVEATLRRGHDKRESEFLESFERVRAQPSERAGPVGWPHVLGPASHLGTDEQRRDTGMELTEVGRRIFGQHWRLILSCVMFVLIGFGIAALARGGSQTYTASARLVLDTADPKTRAESTSIADTGKAIATSPAQVRAALNDAHIRNRDPVDVAKNHVSIRPLGTSAVLQLSVSDKNRHVAAAVANALAGRVIRARLAVSNGQLQQVLTDLEQRIEGLNTGIASVDARIDSLNIRLANAGTGAAANTLRARRDGATRSRDFLAQQRAVLESERVSLLSTDALRPKPSIISPAALPAHADASHWLAYLLLCTILGLILGVGWAGLLEGVRPTVVGSDAIALELGTPLLGTLPDEPDEEVSTSLPPISARVWFAAEAAGVADVALVPAVSNLELGALAGRLEELPPGAVRPEVASDDTRPRLRVRPSSFRDLMADAPGELGLLLVVPTEIKKAKLSEFNELVRLTSAPLLGLVTYPPRSVRQRARARKQALETLAARQAQASSPQV